jgi:hypothetical protein
VVINVAGPSLNPFGLVGLANPTLTLVRQSDNTIIATNDDWQTQANAADNGELLASGFHPNDPAEPAIIATLQPGAYTAIVQGVGGGTGVGLVGVFRDDHDFNLRTRVVELIYAADACKIQVAEYYQAHGVFAPSLESGCSTAGGAEWSPATVNPNNGAITVSAAGGLATGLTGFGSGTDLVYTPVLAGGAGSAIVGWDCKTGTTIAARFLPAACQ